MPDGANDTSAGPEGAASPTFGRLDRVDLRTAWTREDTHFTPWLARDDNLALLAETLGLQLELVGQEESVGPFRADILCRNASDGSMVLVENQIERTDHGHLGQVITYAAGLDAVTIVWIAARFAEEHRAALDWLNDVSHDGIRFFGLEVELWRIGSSPVAPKFNLVVKPNDWSKLVRESKSGGATTEHQAFRREFWEGFLQHLERTNSTISSNRTPSRDSWMDWGVGRSDFALMATVGFRDNWVNACIVSRDREAYDELEGHREALERAVGQGLKWDLKPDRKQNYASVESLQIDPMDRTNWPECWRWLGENLGRLDSAFRGIVA